MRTERALREVEEIFEDVPVPFHRATPGARGRFLRVNPALIRLLEADEGALEDITRRREPADELSRQARYDQRTDLANRRHCEPTLQTETERSDRYGQPLPAPMIDIDYCKRINDARGHAASDRIPEWVAGLLRKRVRETDLAGRWGGEECVVLLPSTAVTKAHRLAREPRQQ